MLVWKQNKTISSDNLIRRRKVKKIIFWSIIGLIGGTILYVIATGLVNIRKITADSGSVNDASFFRSKNGQIDPDSLTTEGDGRVNFLVLGMGGANHPGGFLADSIMIISFDTVNKKTSILSVPRDLYVPVSGKTYGKINSVYANAMGNKLSTQSGDSGAMAMKSTLNKVLDMPIHYYFRIDFQGFQKLVDAVGGVEVNVTKPLSDPYYPDEKMIGYVPFNVKAGLQKMNGQTALKYARSRETTSDFDRARRQQQIVEAIATKSSSLGVFANPKRLVDILNTLGDHVRTDFSFGNIAALASLVKDSDIANATNLVLDTSSESPLTSSNLPGVGYAIYPKVGKTDYIALQDYVHKFMPEPYLLKENARITIAYSNTYTKQAETLKNHLSAYGYNLVATTKIDSIPSQTEVYFYKNYPYTEKLLLKRLSAKKTNSNIYSSQIGSNTTDIIIMAGKDIAKITANLAISKSVVSN